MTHHNESIDRRRVLTGLFLITTSILSTQHSAFAEEVKSMDKTTIEIVTFKLAAGVSDDAFLKHSETVNAFIKSQKGFISRRLSRSDDGTYVDHVTWASLPDALAAMEVSMKTPSLAPFMQSIDMTTVKIEHQKVVASLN